MSQQFPYKVVIDYITAPLRQKLQDFQTVDLNIKEHIQALDTLLQFVSSLKNLDDKEQVRKDGCFTDALQESLLILVREVCFPLIYYVQTMHRSEKINQERTRFFGLNIKLVLTCAQYLEENQMVAMVSQLFVPLFSCHSAKQTKSQVLKSKLDIYHTSMTEPLNELSSLEMISPLLSNKAFFIKFLNSFENMDVWLYELYEAVINTSTDDKAFCKSFTSIAKIFSYCPAHLRKTLEDEVWSNYTKPLNGNVNSDSYWKCLFVFYCLKDYLFPVEGLEKEKLCAKICSNKFWAIVQGGLLSQEPNHRKLSMYLVKRLVDTCTQNSCTLNTPKVNQDTCGGDPLFWWSPCSKQELVSVWENFFLIIETLEEKQVHVIKPILPRMQKLIDASASMSIDGLHLLHSSWLITIITRCFHHDSHFLSRWGAQTLLSMDFAKVPLVKHQQLKFLSNDLLVYLQENKLYSRYDGTELGMSSPVSQALKSFFNNLLSTLTKHQKSDYLRNLLQIVCDNNWGSIPLVFIFEGLSHVTTEPFIDAGLLCLIKQLLQSCLASIEPVTRGAIQCFICQSLLNMVDLSSTSLREFFSALAFLNREEIFQRGTTLWASVVCWIQSRSSSLMSQDKLVFTEVLDYLEAKNEGDNCSVVVDGYRVVGLARMLMLLADAEVENTLLTEDEVKKNLLHSPLGSTLGEVSGILQDLRTRAYINTDKVKRCLSMIYSLVMEEGKPHNMVDMFLWRHLGEHFDEVSYFVMTRLLEHLVKPEDIDEIELYIDVLLCLGLRSQKSLKETQVLLNFVHKTFSVSLKGGNSEQNLDLCDLHCTAAMKLLAVTLEILKSQTEDFALCPSDISSAIFSMTCVADVPLPFARKRDSNESFTKSQVGRLISFFISCKWKCQKLLVELSLNMPTGDSKNSLHSNLRSILEGAMEDMGLGSGASDVEILQTVEIITSQLLQDTTTASSFVKMLKLSWLNVIEEKKNANYWRKLKAFIPVLLHRSVFLQDNAVIEASVKEYMEKLNALSADKTGIMYLVLDHLCERTLKEDADRQIATKLIPFLVEGCYTGSLSKRGERVWLDVCSYIESLGSSCSVNEITSSMSRNDLFTRVIVLNWLSTLRPYVAADHTFVVQFLEALKGTYMDLAVLTTYKQFSNSLSHRQKHRMSLVFLLLADFITKDICDSFLPDLWQALELECHPSVRQNIEWLVMLLMIRFPDNVNNIWEIMIRYNDKRSVCLCSLFLIISHIGPKLPGHIQVPYFKKALSTLLPWTMAHHYNTRIFAQTAVVRLWEQVQSLSLKEVETQYFVVPESIQFMFSNSNASDTVHKLLNNYIYSSFDPVRDFSMETIFYTLPKLACLADEEWIRPDYFVRRDARWQGDGSKCLIQLLNPSDQLALCKKGPWRSKAQAENEDDIVESADGDVQKKIMPWRQMSPDQETEAELDFQRVKPTGRLILVTSLIDKVPNLGGLCRTSEIFGVSEFVIGNLTHIEDRMFQNLSVSAQKWIPITEVMRPKLLTYLEEKKLEGYTLVGVEQTANSVSLKDYKFPEKTLLLLGNEREGIPVEIIQSLDICVEIPQQGVIRSLNVHVCGALFVWEYTRQHMQESQSNILPRSNE
ncbi:methyltransferase TARBP1 [Biomphalaria glabrata]|nr:putative methyltransferase TARBP1 [Biomphalaria glabrata]